MSKLKKVGLGLLLAFLIFQLGLHLKKPSNERNWEADQALLAHAEISDGEIFIKNIRDIQYETEGDYTVEHYDRVFKLDELVTLDYLVVPFGSWKGPAHTMLSFGFETAEGMEHLVVSVEIRKEEGESYSPLRGLFRSYELMYVIADEEDVIKLRTHHRDDPVYMYPVKAEAEPLQALFISIMERVNELEARPEFYNTLFSSCTSNLASHVNLVSTKKIPTLGWRVVLPAYSDKLAYDRGLFDTDLGFEAAKDHFRIDENAQLHNESGEISFSEWIRSER